MDGTVTEARLWRTTPGEALALFADALRALVPVAERARMPWREGAAYDDWDRVAAALFKSLVADSLAHAVECEGWPPLASYGAPLSLYDTNTPHLADVTEDAPLVSLVSVARPFDTCLLARLGPDGRVAGHFRKPAADVTGALVARRGVPPGAEASTLSVRL